MTLIVFGSINQCLILTLYKTLIFDLIQAVYNANKFAKLVKKRKKLKNWLEYYRFKFERNTDKRPTLKVNLFQPNQPFLGNMTMVT